VSVENEFATVDAVIASGAETRGVDAFALALIKTERQARRLFTHLVFQMPSYDASDIPILRQTLAANRRVYFEGFIRGWDALYIRSVRILIGAEYDRLLSRIAEAIDHRNKIFHGQLTRHQLSRDDLLGYVKDIRCWCSTFATAAHREIGYDGFARSSFRKSPDPTLQGRVRLVMNSMSDYELFIKVQMQR
jgi:hypothetical protein